MCPPECPRVLLADDYPELVAAIERWLEQDCEVVGSVADGEALLEAAGRLRPDVIVLDLNMPNLNGLEACRQITHAIPQTKVIVLTAANDAAVMRAALAAGAVAFITKQAIAEQLLPTIKRVGGER